MGTKTLEQSSATNLSDLQIDNMLAKIQQGNLTPQQMQWFINLSHEKREQLMHNHSQTPSLKFRDDVELTIDAVDGKKVFAKVPHLFNDVDGEVWDATYVSPPTPETGVRLYEVIKNGSSRGELIRSLDEYLEDLCLTPAQVINFHEKHAHASSDILHQPFPKFFFLSKIGKNLRVVTTFGGTVSMIHFEDSFEKKIDVGVFRPVIVVPLKKS